MASVPPLADQAADLLQKLSLGPQAKTLEIPQPIKKTAVYQYGSVDSNGQVPSFDRSVTPVLPDIMDPTICYIPNGYPHYYYGGYGTGHEWNEYSSYTNPDGVDMASGVYGENGSLVYSHGYGYAQYPYSPATSPVPTVGNDGQLYGAQQYQYPSFFPLTPTSGPFSSTVAASSQGELSTSKDPDQKPLSVETANAASNAVSKSGVTKGSTGSGPMKPATQSSFNASVNSYGSGAFGGGFPGSYQDPRFGYDGFHSPMLWHDGSKSAVAQRSVSDTGVTSSFSKVSNNVPSSRNQNYRSNSHFMGLHQPTSVSEIGTAQGYFNRVYPNKLYGQYGSAIRSGMGYGSIRYDSQTNGREWLAADNKYRPRGRVNNYFYGNENADGLNELNRGPRAKSTKNQKGTVETALAVKGPNGTSNVTDNEGMDKTCVVPNREQSNREDFPEDYTEAKFFVIKSYSEDDVHKSIKYNVWASTPNGNKKLDAAYQEAKQKSRGCPVFLFFSVNASGQFVGTAEMVGPVDFNKNVEYWQQDKWTGSFPLKWHIVKDVPNSLLKHIILENNENKPVTNSRDTQEVKLEQGLKIIKIFKEHSSKTCILDDFEFYEARQKSIQEKKGKQQLSQKQVWEGKSVDEKKESAIGSHKPLDASVADSAKESASAIQANAKLKVSENGSVAKTDSLNGAKQVGVLTNGMANGC